jgi:polyhydroxyalkanoate synthase
MPEKPQDRPAFDPAELARLYSGIAEKSALLFSQYLARQTSASPAKEDELGLNRVFMDAWQRLLSDPLQMAESQLRFAQDYWQLWQNTALQMMGQQAPAPVAQPAKGDRRFRHEDWQQSFLFDYIKQSYLVAARHLHQTMASVQGLDEQTAKKVDFFTRQYIDALSPSNFLLTNPEVLRETAASGGQNLVRGLNNLLDDLTRGNGELKLKMTDEKAFGLGVNLALTPGKVVYQNDLIQLIQYSPATRQVYRRPLLIMPPWINKYYILDMRENNSFVKWAVEAGHTVFIVSWVNPDERHAGKTFEDYLNEGALAALDAVGKATGESEVNMVGFCLGGTLLSTMLGHLAAKGDKRVASATFLATLIDFDQAGELEVFVDEAQVAALEKRMASRGYLEGSEMATTFNMLRANDLIWSFVVNNYLLGRDPLPFDLLYWNSDSTRMPAAMHSYYLRHMYIRNLLPKPGGITLNGTPIDLSRVTVPAYFASTIEDHIAPWKSTYAGAKLFTGPVRFVLGGSGHIAGIVNPPAAAKYGYWTNDALPAKPDEWLQGAGQHPNSWWSDWAQWLATHGGGKVAARKPGAGQLAVIEDAPGAYVKIRIDTRPATASAG